MHSRDQVLTENRRNFLNVMPDGSYNQRPQHYRRANMGHVNEMPNDRVRGRVATRRAFARPRTGAQPIGRGQQSVVQNVSLNASLNALERVFERARTRL